MLSVMRVKSILLVLSSCNSLYIESKKALKIPCRKRVCTCITLRQKKPAKFTSQKSIYIPLFIEKHLFLLMIRNGFLSFTGIIILFSSQYDAFWHMQTIQYSRNYMHSFSDIWELSSFFCYRFQLKPKSFDRQIGDKLDTCCLNI